MPDPKVYCAHDEMVEVEKLVPHPRNPNTHPDSQIALLAKVIQAQGWRQAITVSKLSGFIVKGHGRLMAARVGGCLKVPVDYQDYENEAAEHADMVADNRIAELAEIDRSVLKDLMEDLDTGAFDMDLTGFDSDSLEELMTSMMPPIDPDPDDVPPVQEDAITEAGRIYQLGRHRLMCGDATSSDDVGRLMGEDIADVLFTSPPYNLGDSFKLSGNSKSKDGNAYLSYVDSVDYKDMLDGFLEAWRNVSNCQIVNVQPLAGCKRDLMRWIAENVDFLCDIVTWDKGHAQPAMAPGVLSSRFEWLVMLGEHDASRTVPFSSWHGTMSTVYEASPQRNNEFAQIHGATFPIHLPVYVMTQLCDSSKIIADCFGGTGTTLIACEQADRDCRMMELDPRYCDVIVKRYAKLVGADADKIFETGVHSC